MQKIVEHENARFVTETRLELQADQSHLLQGRSNESAEAAIHKAMKRGQSYDIQAYKDLFEFIVLQLTFGPGFEDAPAQSHIKEILQDQHTAPPVKILQVRHQMNS